MRLRDSGLDVPDDVITEEQLADYLVSVSQKQGRKSIDKEITGR